MRRVLGLVAAASIAACTTGTTDSTKPAADITIIGGAGQSGFTGVTLSQPIVVKVTAADGTPLAGQTVDFTVASGTASLNPTSAVTGTDGTAQTQVTIGSTSGSVTIVAQVRATTIETSTSVAVQSNTSSVTCTSQNTLVLAIGEARTSLLGGGICLQSSTSAQYLVHAFYSSTVASAQTQVGIAGFGITASSSASMGSASAGSLSSAPASGLAALSRTYNPAAALDLRLREMEKSVLRPRMSGARSAFRRGGGNLATAPSQPPTVGQILQLNVNEGCDEVPRYRYGRVAAITNKAIVVADTGNPAGGFTDADYQSIGVTFDTLVYPLDTAAFGGPTDIDSNGRILLFYTRAVNELTPAKSQGIIEGFFNPRDLFPRTATGSAQACSGSNFAEMFYLIVPDPQGTINGNVRSKADVQQFTIGVTGHEFQHLINAARRLYVNNATDFEEVWLNEGLSHIAEELLFYREAALTPRSNIDAPTIQASQKRVDAFNNYQGANFGRYELFLETPLTSSPYADNDSLSNRGAIWDFLRYAADRKATTDGTIWFQLVNSPTTGIANLQTVFGSDIVSQFRDWSISAYTDDLVSTTTSFQQPSWNFRSIFPKIGVTTFPLEVFNLQNGVQTTQTLSAGGSLYTTVGAAAGSTISVAWSIGTSNVLISVVRTK